MIVLFAVLGFLSGSILYSAFLPLVLKGVDVRTEAADHNPGAANAFKYGGRAVGILSLFCDLAKGYLPVWLALNYVTADTPGFSLVIAAPVLGHAFSPFAHFKGGKAIAASFGALLALLPQDAVVLHLAFWYIFFSVLVVVRPHAVRTILAFALTALWALKASVAPIAFGVFLVFCTTGWRHLPSVHQAPFSIRLIGFKSLPRFSAGSQ